MKLRRTDAGVIVEDPERGRWVALPGEASVLALLADPEAAGRVAARIEEAADDEF